MDLSPRSIGDVLVLAPAGRLDHESVDAFRSDLQVQLDAALEARRAVLFDLSGLEYVSSAGLRCFMLAARQAKAKDGRMAVAAPRPVVAEIFEISRFNLVFRIFPTMQEALGFLSGGRLAVRVRFWGTRGSLPVSLTWRDMRDRLVQALVLAAPHNLDTAAKAQAFIAKHFEFSLSHTYGGHSSCVELETAASVDAGQYFVCDMGSGARAFGEHVLARQSGRPATVHIFMSHMHWDHIMGFPFFRPAYHAEYRLRIYGCHEQLEHAFRLQQDPPCFPVPFSALTSSIEFVRLAPGETHQIEGLSVTPMLQLHSGDSYGYRFEADERSVVYTTDSEHKLEEAGESEKYAFFFRDADLVIFDAMYSLADAISVKADWGHSSNVIGVELCQLAGAKRLALYHHEPANDDKAIERILDETRRLEELTRETEPLEILAAYDGLEIDL